jgi:predicted N-acetyltransferase YhbS
MPHFRPLIISDLPQILAVQRSAYQEVFHEPSETFAGKLALFPRGALGIFEGDSLAAYFFCHPGVVGETVPLRAEHLVLPERPNCLYIHDLAVAQRCRGRGLAARLAGEAFELAEALHLPACALVSVQGSETFWERLGFMSQQELEYLPGIAANYMVRTRP